MAKDTRDRMIKAAVNALGRRGVAGMSFTEILDESGASRGSIYHHFPGGKNQLVAEAAARTGRDVQANLAALQADNPVTVVESFLALARSVIEASGPGIGSAIAAVTFASGEAAASLRDVAAAAFASWTSTLADRLTASGLAPDTAADVATTLLGLLEGTRVLCRAAGSLAPFDQMSRTALGLTRARHSAP